MLRNASARRWAAFPGSLSTVQWLTIIGIQVLIGILLLCSPLLALAVVLGVAVVLPGMYLSPTFIYALILLSIPSQYATEGTRGMADIKLVHMATVAGCVTWVIQWAKGRKIEIDFRWVDVPILLFIGFAFMTAFWADDTQRTLFFDIKLTFAFVTYFIMIFLIRDKEALNRVLLIWVAVCFFWSIAGMYTMLFESIPAAQEVELPEGIVPKLGKTVRISAIFANPNELAFFLSIAMVLAVVLFRTSSESKWKVMATLSILLASMVLIGTFSRKSWLAIILSLSILCIRDRRVLAGFAITGAIAVVLIVVSAGSSSQFVSALYNRAMSFFLDPEVAMAERATVWILAMELFSHAPILGNGAGSFYIIAPTVGSDLPIPHSLYLLLLVEYGLVGLSIFFLLVVVCTVGLLRIFKGSDDERTRYFALGLLAALASVLFQALFKTLAFTNYNFLSFFALVATFLRVHGGRAGRSGLLLRSHAATTGLSGSQK